MRKKQIRSMLSCGDLTAEVTRKSMRTIRIRIVNETGQIRVSAPYGTKDDAIRSLLTQHRQWILARQLDVKTKPRSRPDLISGTEMHVLGRRYVLQVERGVLRRAVRLVEDVLLVSIRMEDDPDVISALVDHWIDCEIRDAVADLAKIYEPQMGVRMGTLAIRTMRSRWGSCNVQTGRICINRALAWESPDLLEYILVHEMAHLIERGHTRQFYAVVDAHYPRRKEAEARLRILSATLA